MNPLNPTDASKALAKAFGNESEQWVLLYSQGNFIYGSPSRIAKIARTQDEKWVDHGLKVAILAGDNGIRAVNPLINSLVKTDLGLASLWPRVRHDRIAPNTLDTMRGYQLGRELALISQLKYGEPGKWDPFHRLSHRVSVTKYPADLVEDILRLVDTLKPLIPNTILDSSKFLFSHADAHIGNMLFNSHGINIIDFDSSNWYPVGWDLAFLYNHLVLEHANEVAYEAVKAGYLENGGRLSTEPNILSLIKATISTTYALTLNPTPERIRAVMERVKVISKWIEELASPVSMPTFKYFD